MKDNPDFILAKVVAVGSAGGAVINRIFSPGASLPFFEVSLTAFGMIVAGSMMGFLYGPSVESRRKLFGYAVGGVFIGVWTVKVLPQWLGWQWYTPEMAGAVGGSAALLSRWAIPLIINYLPAMFRRPTNSGDNQ